MHRTGVIKIAQFSGAIEIYSRPTPVVMATKWLFLNRKLAVARLCKNIAQNLVPNTFRVTTSLANIWHNNGLEHEMNTTSNSSRQVDIISKNCNHYSLSSSHHVTPQTVYDASLLSVQSKLSSLKSLFFHQPVTDAKLISRCA